jgi:hypothetical protein
VAAAGRASTRVFQTFVLGKIGQFGALVSGDAAAVDSRSGERGRDQDATPHAAHAMVSAPAVRLLDPRPGERCNIGV